MNSEIKEHEPSEGGNDRERLEGKLDKNEKGALGGGGRVNRPPALRWRLRSPEGRRLFNRRQVLLVSLLALTLGALLSSGSLVGLAERQEVGSTRTVALRVANFADRVANFVSLNRPADAVSAVLEGDASSSQAAGELLKSVGGTQTHTFSVPARTTATTPLEADPVEVTTSPPLDTTPTSETSATLGETTPPESPEFTVTTPENEAEPPGTPPATGTVEIPETTQDSPPGNGQQATPPPAPPEPQPSPPGGGIPTSTQAPSAASSSSTTTTEATSSGVCQLDSTLARASEPIALRLSEESPLRIYVGGDSLSRDLGEGLARVAPNDLVDVELDTRAATGLSRPDFFDWPTHLAEILTNEKPDVVVLMFGANDFQNVEYGNRVLDRYQDDWLQLYCRRVDFVMALVSQPETKVMWVGQPPARSSRLSGGFERLNSVYAEVAEWHPSVSFVDTWGLFSDNDGNYSDIIAGVRVRRDDGVHLTIAGGNRLATAVWETLAANWRISSE